LHLICRNTHNSWRSDEAGTCACIQGRYIAERAVAVEIDCSYFEPVVGLAAHIEYSERGLSREVFAVKEHFELVVRAFVCKELVAIN